ncbi:MAG: hypothetical protein A2855_02965 [Candidatus Liptonbacteria bacterium RIFCSPHIGHO2_01_FULL_57_28]|uniref:SpoVT-AbrB domain-containing protein n=1 Tax=Candidatus Liptonbacteria bacterium RIFCSPHIGHO2_01_FULL_57_28 TaxID=1798647 RepID=A0A1G2C8W2_9BACT|nr:MAG: hypothetical protein A2855_02965 [Candidatus Liptonbacteria bacterium RIFCSPHIGHO2_01_FULL_57_28]
MTQKVIKVGSSDAMVIPKDYMREMKLKTGNRIHISMDKDTGTLLVSKAENSSKDSVRTAELVMRFINRYRKDLEKLRDL